MQQCARQLTDPFDGFLLGKRYLLHDRDTKFTAAFDGLLKGSDVEPIVLPPRSPNLNAHCERFVRSIKEEALDQVVILGERGLHHVVRQYLIHYHTERTHQGLGNVRIAPAPANDSESGRVVRRTPRRAPPLLLSGCSVIRRYSSTIRDKTYVIEDICKTLNISRATLYRYISGAGSPTASRSRN